MPSRIPFGRPAVKRSAFAALAAVVIGAVAIPALADGNETLGPPSIDVPSVTSGVAVSGVGLFGEPEPLSVTIPEGATPTRVLLYWETGVPAGQIADDSVTLNGVEITGTLIGGPDFFYNNISSSTYRADITAMGLVKSGTSTMTVNGLTPTQIDDGLGIMVFYDEPGKEANVMLVDGNDTAFVDFPAPRDKTVPQTFDFRAFDVDRKAEVGFFVASVQGGLPDEPRPHAAYVTVGGETTRIDSPFTNNAGNEFDYYTITVDIPAGADSLTLQLSSEADDTDNLPASLIWLATYVTVPEPVSVTPQAPETEVKPLVIVPEAPSQVAPIELTPQFTG